jgi:hypothetical protein
LLEDMSPYFFFPIPAGNYTAIETRLMVIKQSFLFFNIKTYDVM